MGKHYLLRCLTRRHQDVDSTPISPIPRRYQGYKTLLGNGGRVYMLWHSRSPRHDILLRSDLRILEPFAHRQVHQQTGSLARPFGHKYRDRCDHISYPSTHSPPTEYEYATEDRCHWGVLHRYRSLPDHHAPAGLYYNRREDFGCII